MTKIEWITKIFGERDPMLRSYLKTFYSQNKELSETNYAEKLNSDPMFNLIVKNISLQHSKRSSLWIQFLGVLFLIFLIISIITQVATNSNLG